MLVVTWRDWGWLSLLWHKRVLVNCSCCNMEGLWCTVKTVPDVTWLGFSGLFLLWHGDMWVHCTCCGMERFWWTISAVTWTVLAVTWRRFGGLYLLWHSGVSVDCDINEYCAWCDIGIWVGCVCCNKDEFQWTILATTWIRLGGLFLLWYSEVLVDCVRGFSLLYYLLIYTPCPVHTLKTIGCMVYLSPKTNLLPLLVWSKKFFIVFPRKWHTL